MMKTIRTFFGAFVLVGAVFAASQRADAQATSDYSLSPSDILSVVVFDEPSLTMQVKVSASGDVTYPLLGALKVGGKTAAQVETEIRQLLAADYMVNPSVIVNVITYRLREVNITGAVNQPRAIELQAEQKMTILQAIAKAGGFNPKANKSKIHLQRAGKPQETFTEKDLAKQVESDNSFYLEPGDIIKVEESFF